MEKHSIANEIHELNIKLDVLLGLYIPWYMARSLKSKTWLIGYLSDCGLNVEYIASVTGLKGEEVRKEKLRAKEEKARPPSHFDIFREK